MVRAYLSCMVKGERAIATAKHKENHLCTFPQRPLVVAYHKLNVRYRRSRGKGNRQQILCISKFLLYTFAQPSEKAAYTPSTIAPTSDTKTCIVLWVKSDSRPVMLHSWTKITWEWMSIGQILRRLETFRELSKLQNRQTGNKCSRICGFTHAPGMWVAIRYM